MIDPQTTLVAVAACVVIAAVWAWGIVREDAAVVRGYASGIEAGRALERTAARGAIVADTTTGDPAPPMPCNRTETGSEGPERPADVFGRDAAPSTLSAGGDAGQPDASARRAIPAWLRAPGGSEGRD